MRSSLLITSALVASSACAPLAFAQAVDPDAPLVAERIIVSLPGRDRDADELIGNATILERDELVRTLRPSLGDTLDSEPGVSSTSFGPAASRPVIRGLGSERVLVLTNGIGVIDASAASPDHQVAADGIDAQRIEILRGPAALAYGGQAVGGVVNVIDGLIAEKPLEEDAELDGFAAFDSVNDGTELALRGAVQTGPFVFSAFATDRDADDLEIPGFAESSRLRALEEAEEEGEEDGHEEEEEARDTLPNSFFETGSFGFGASYIGEKFFLGGAIRHQTAEYGLPGHGHEHEEEEGGEEEEGEEEENPFIDLEQTRYDLRGSYHVHGEVIDRVSGTFSIADYEHTEFEAPGEAGTVFESEGYEGRLEVTHQAIGGFEGAFGLQFLDKELSAEGEESFISETDTENWGVFVYETTEFESGFGIEGGLRLEVTDVDNVNLGSRDYTLGSGSIGLHQHFENGFFLGVQASLTERAPTDVELFADGPHLATNQFEIGDATLDEERAYGLEGAARWTGERLSIGANIYITSFDNFIYLAPEGREEDDLPVFMFSQQDAEFIGGEIYGEFDAGRIAGADWTIEAALDWVDAELDDGQDVPFIPPVTTRVGLDGEWEAFSAGLTVTHAADQDDPGVGSLPTDSYTTLDLRAAYTFSTGERGEAELFLEGRNVTDEEVRLATSVLKDVAPLGGASVRAGVRLSY